MPRTEWPRAMPGLSVTHRLCGTLREASRCWPCPSGMGGGFRGPHGRTEVASASFIFSWAPDALRGSGLWGRGTPRGQIGELRAHDVPARPNRLIGQSGSRDTSTHLQWKWVILPSLRNAYTRLLPWGLRPLLNIQFKQGTL